MVVALCGSAVWLWLSGARERTLVAAVLEMAAIYRSLALSPAHYVRVARVNCLPKTRG
jgi:hypothetical protein